jgi:hypothetical protein
MTNIPKLQGMKRKHHTISLKAFKVNNLHEFHALFFVSHANVLLSQLFFSLYIPLIYDLEASSYLTSEQTQIQNLFKMSKNIAL